MSLIVKGTSVYLGGTASANKLDDYEEGTFTPTVYGGTTAGTYTTTYATGFYTKVGREVSFVLEIAVTSFTGTGNFHVGGLPFTNRNATVPASVQWNNSPFATYSSDNQLVAGIVTLNSSVMQFRASSRSASGGYQLLQCGPSTVGYLRIKGSYTTD